MKHYDIIERNIELGDVGAIREAIGSICYTNRDFSSGEFDEVIAYVESRGIRLKDDKLTGKPPISTQKDVFTDDDYSRAIYELKKNFCDERIEDVKTIGKALYSNNKVKEDHTEEKTVKTEGKDPNAKSHQTTQPNKTLIIVLVAGIVLIIIGIVIVIKRLNL